VTQPKIPGLGRLARAQEPELVDGEGSALERRLLAQLLAAGVPEPRREYRFAPPRLWRFDFAWPALLLAVEVEGGVWLRNAGRHTRPLGYQADLRKYNAAAMAGWLLLRYSERDIHNGKAAKEIGLVIDARGTYR
jgi:hypothetical protein